MNSKTSKILDNLTLDEKIDLLSGNSEGIGLNGLPEKGIPRIQMADGPMGAHWWCDTSPAYPASVGLAASWDTELAKEAGKNLGRDCRARGVHILLGPGVNIYRSPRCGRNFEYMGEDPYLAGKISASVIRGIQSQKVSATIKHYAVNFQEYDRHNVSSDLDLRTLHEIYLPAFKKAVTEGNAGYLMTAYNLVNDIHCSEHGYLIREVLREKWGFKGIVMSDWNSVYSTAGTVKNGLDLEMPNAKYWTKEKIHAAIDNGEICESDLDEKVNTLLSLCDSYGWLDNEQLDKSISHMDETSLACTEETAAGGIVLLKNESGLLPLKPDKVKHLAVIGCTASPAVYHAGGSAYVPSDEQVSILDGIKAKAPDGTKVTFARGPDAFWANELFKTSEFLTPDGQLGLRGEYFNNNELKGEPEFIRIDGHIDFTFAGNSPDERITNSMFSIRWQGSVEAKEDSTYLFFSQGVDSDYRVYVDDKKVIDTLGRSDAGIKETPVILTSGQHDLKIEWSKNRHWTRFCLGYGDRAKNEQRELDALNAADDADTVLLCAGFNNHSEGEGFDRPFELPPVTVKLIDEVLKKNKNVILNITAGGAVDLDKWIDKLPAVIQSWYLGSRGANALGRIIFGDISPSGKLPFSWERKAADNPTYDNYLDDDGDKKVALKEGIFVGYRHYDRVETKALFPFGHGLSYTSFSMSDLQFSSETLKSGEDLKVKFIVENTGGMKAAEICQLYISDLESRVPRPIKELKGFSRILLAAGERKTVTLTLEPDDFKYYDPDIGDWILEAGDFEVLIGNSSENILLKGKVSVG